MNLRFKCSVVSGGDNDETPTPPAPKPPPPPAPTPTKPDDCKDAARTPYTWRGCSRYKAEKDPKRIFEGQALMRRMIRYGILDEDKQRLDYLLNLKVENFLERRLQTLVYKRGL